VHVGVLSLALLFCRLGWWQWDRARSATGGVQNVIYALQWPSFAVFGLVMWWKSVRDELHPAARSVVRRDEQPRVYAVAAEDPEDEELAAYNRYLAWLSARDAQRSR
jgi:DNA-binding transcriptional regulator of glucitol operon